MTGWHLVKTKYVDSAFSGEGARLVGGRWNSPGKAMVYASANLSLAILEQLARYGRVDSLLKNYMVIAFEFDKSLLNRLDITTLPKKWDINPPTYSTQKIGDRWIKDKYSVIFEVPSAINPKEFNLLVNPLHPNFSKIFLHPP